MNKIHYQIVVLKINPTLTKEMTFSSFAIDAMVYSSTTVFVSYFLIVLNYLKAQKNNNEQ